MTKKEKPVLCINCRYYRFYDTCAHDIENQPVLSYITGGRSFKSCLCSNPSGKCANFHPASFIRRKLNVYMSTCHD